MYCKNCGGQLTKVGKFCKNCGQEFDVNKLLVLKSKIFERLLEYKAFYIFFAVIILLVASSYFESSETSETINNDIFYNTASEIKIVDPVVSSSVDTIFDYPVKLEGSDLYNQEEIIAAVVNIYCPSMLDEDGGSGGTGTIIDKDGLILTNSHIIPQDENNIHVSEEGCLVILPDSITGQPKDYYYARPIVLNELSDKYDLAYMQIYKSYFDKDRNMDVSLYPRNFPNFNDTTRCSNKSVRLGESVRIFGYPSISGGYSLTLTEGVVSSFPGDGLIVTSAKISHGNSGGLAVDGDGCMIGVPSMVSSDESESLGVIISKELIYKFDGEVEEYIKKLNSN